MSETFVEPYGTCVLKETHERSTTWQTRERQVHVDKAEVCLYHNLIINCLDQGRISSLVAQIFDIKHDYYGSLTSGLAQVAVFYHEMLYEIREGHCVCGVM